MFGNPRPGTDFPGMTRVVRGGTLDDTSWLRPSAHFWIRSAQPCVQLSEGAAIHDTQPNSN